MRDDICYPIENQTKFICQPPCRNKTSALGLRQVEYVTQERVVPKRCAFSVFEVVIMSPVLSAQEEADEIIAEFSFFDDWADRYQHLIDQGRRLPQIRPEWQDEAHILKGCQSVVYFGMETDSAGCAHFSASSDAAIVQGLIALLLRVYSGRPPSEIIATGPEFLSEIGLDKHLSPTRKNGLASMVEAIKGHAQDLTLS